MKINIALFDKNKMYTDRLVKGMQANYAKNVSIKVFSDEQYFASEIKSQYFDIAIIDYECASVRNCVPDRTVITLLVKDNTIEEYEGIPAIGKFQKVENIYKRIVGIYADNSAGLKVRGRGTKANVVYFTSAQGGVGTSSVAAAYAIRLAFAGEKVFYLNLERFGSANSFFSGEGNGSFSDVIYALKSKNVNFSLKLQSTLKTDQSGVDFVDGCRNAFDMMELKDNEIMELVEGISIIDNYDAIVIDYSGTLDSRQQLLMREHADSIVYVCDGSEIGNDKFLKFCEAVRVIEKRENGYWLSKMGLLYNRYSSKTSKQLEKIPVMLYGGIHRIEGITGRDLVDELTKQEMLSNIS